MDTPRFRIGNDLTIFWAINNRDGSPYDLDGKEVRLFMTHERGREEVEAQITQLEPGIRNNVIRWDFKAADQRILGTYTLTLVVLESGTHRELTKDYGEAFTLVGRSEMESEEGDANISIGGDLILSTKLDVYRIQATNVDVAGLKNQIYDVEKGLTTKVEQNEYDAKTGEIDEAFVKVETSIGNINTEIKDTSGEITGIKKSIDEIKKKINNFQPGEGGSDGFWYIDEATGNLVTDKQVEIKNNLIVGGDTASTGVGEDPGTTGIDEAQLKEYLDENKYITSDYAYSKQEIDNKIPSLDGYVTNEGLTKTLLALNLGQYLKSDDAENTYAKITELKKYLLLESANQTIKGNITIEGNLVVTGDTSSGAKGTDSGVARTLLGIKVNGTTYDKPVNGILTIPDYPTSLAWSAIEGKPTKLSQFTNDAGFITSAALANYLLLSGGTINGTASSPLQINTSSATIGIPLSVSNSEKAWFGWSAGQGVYILNAKANKYLGIKEDGTPYYDSYTLIHSGNIGSQSVQSANEAMRFKDVASSGDLNTVLAGGGMARTYSNYLSTDFTNAPSDSRYGAVLQLSTYAFVGLESLSAQLAWDVNHASTTDTTRHLWWRVADSSNIFKYAKWHQIAFTDSNVASATKLATARTIWGQSFDGTGNVDGALNIKNAEATITVTANQNTYFRTKGVSYELGFGIGSGGTNRGIYDFTKASWMIYRDSTLNVLIPQGNVGIGTTSPSAKLHVNGNAIITGDTSSGSDIRFKDKIEDVMLDIKAIADMPLFTFRWNDREDKTIHLGSSAQYWEKHRSELVYGEDFKSLNYPVLGAAGMKTIAIEVIKLWKEVTQLKRMINHGS